LTVPTIYALVHENKMPYYKKGKKLYFRKDEINEWLMEVRNKSKLELTKNCGSIHKKKSTVSFQQNCRQRNCQLKTKKPYNQTITRLKVEKRGVVSNFFDSDLKLLIKKY
jgi:excisionase family DNA binding protein